MKQDVIVVPEIVSDLFTMQDTAYKSFHQPLIPTVEPNLIIGVRTPLLRAYAKQLFGTEKAEVFQNELPHHYYEENNLHGFLIEQIKDVDMCIAALNRFLPYVDNWATCDMLRPKCFRKSHAKLLPYVMKWIQDEHTYTVRFGIGMLLTHFLDEDFDPLYLEQVASVDREEYYVQMMISWYFATALAKQYDSAIIYLQEHKLSPWIHNKTIQKACESFRITKEQKSYLRTLRR